MMQIVKLTKSQEKQVREVNQTIVNSTYMDVLRQLKSRDGSITKELVRCFTQLQLNGMGYYNLIVAGTGVGKTHHIIREFMYMQYQSGTRLGFIIAPEKILVSKSALSAHTKVLKNRLGGKIETLYSPSLSELRSELSSRASDEMLLVFITDSKFNLIVDKVVGLMSQFNLNGKTTFTFDECHISASSENTTYYGNTGLRNPNATCIKFSNIEKILDISYVLGVSATLVKEQIDETFGSSKYKVLNPKGFSKKDIGLSVSGHCPTIFYDEESQGRDKTLMQYLGFVEAKQLEYTTLHNRNQLPTDKLLKLGGLIVLETQYKDKDKDDVKWFKEFMGNPSMTIPVNWDFDIAVDTSEELIVWRLSDGKISELTNLVDEGYETSDDLIHKMKDSTSKLKHLVLVGKGSVGMDIPNLNFILSLRTFTNKIVTIDPHTGQKVSTPVTTRAEQILGRCRRLVMDIQELAMYFNDVEDFIRYYCTINSYQAFLPQSEYWITSQSIVDEKYPSIQEIEQMIREKIGKC